MTSSFVSRLGTSPEEGVKAPVVVVSTLNITLSGEQTISGVAVVSGDRVGVGGQTDATENGIYTCAAGSWSRTTDFNAANDVVSGVLVSDANSNVIYQVTFSGTYTAGTTSVSFTATTASQASLPVVVDTIASLRTTTIVNGYRKYLKAHTTEGDGGHGYFRGVTGASPGTYTHDNGVTVVPSGGDGSEAWVREYSGAINVKWYGAKGDWDGATGTDDTSALQAAIYAGSRGEVFLPHGDYLVSSKLYIKTQTRMVGELVGIGDGENRGVSLVAHSALSDYILENYSITADPSNPLAHGIQVEGIQFRQPSGTKNASGFNVGPAGDQFWLNNIKVNSLGTGIKFGNSGSLMGSQLAANIGDIAVYNCDKGIHFSQCYYVVNINSIIGDSFVQAIHFDTCGLIFHCKINTYHFEQLDSTLTEVFLIENSSGLVELGHGDVDEAVINYDLLKITGTLSGNKARVIINPCLLSSPGNNYLNDTDQSITWAQSDFTTVAPVIRHNMHVVHSGQGSVIFDDDYGPGNWTPVVADAASGGNEGTCTITGAKWQRIGNMGFIQFDISNINTTGLTAGNIFYITGLPITVSGVFAYQYGACECTNITGNPYAVKGLGGGTALRLTKQGGAGDALVSDVTSGSGVIRATFAFYVN